LLAVEDAERAVEAPKPIRPRNWPTAGSHL
jgi:hypothetical protein